MKQFFIRKTIFLLTLFSSIDLNVSAQSASVQNVAKSVFTLTTFKADGSLLASSHGVFVGNQGEAIAAWTPFDGAATAVVIDASGKKMEVEAVVGANELYDVCKFKVAGQTSPAKIATVAATNGSKAWLLGYSVKKATPTAMSILSVEKFMDKYAYYIIPANTPENMAYCPVVNQNGQVLGLAQPSKTAGETHVTDAAFAYSFTSTGLSLNDPLLQRTGIRVDMPSDPQQALLLLMMSGERSDSLHHSQYVDAYIRQYPSLIDGYAARAALLANANRFADVDQEMEDALRKVTRKDEVHGEYAKLIYQKQQFKPDVEYAPWTLSKALEEAKAAYAIQADPNYRHLEAQIIFSQGQYQQAYDLLMELAHTSYRNGELFYEAAQCKSQLGAGQTEVLELLDSAVAACPQPLDNIAAPYVLARGQVYDEMGEYRKAIADYNKYDTLTLGRANHEFFYLRYQCEAKAKLYKQALNDIAHATLLNPRELSYYAELAQLQLRVNRAEDAIHTCDIGLAIDDSYSALYLIKGLALIQNKQPAAGKEAFERAKALGDERADELIRKYK